MKNDIPEHELIKAFKKVAAEEVAIRVASIKRLTTIEPKSPKTSAIVAKLTNIGRSCTIECG